LQQVIPQGKGAHASPTKAQLFKYVGVGWLPFLQDHCWFLRRGKEKKKAKTPTFCLRKSFSLHFCTWSPEQPGCWFATWTDGSLFLKITGDCLKDLLSSLDTREQFWKWLKLDSSGRQAVDALGVRMPALI